MSKYVFKPYDRIFPRLFENEKKRISGILSGKYEIEHIGSTAVPGLGGKNIIDIYVVAPQTELEQIKKDLRKAGYEFIALTDPVRHVFFQTDLLDDIEGSRRYYIHVNSSDSEDFQNAIIFRDYLRKNPNQVKKYAKIKQKAARLANNDRDIYMKIKSPVILEILTKARSK